MLIRKIVLQPINLANAPKRSTDKIALCTRLREILAPVIYIIGSGGSVKQRDPEGEVTVDRMPLGIPLCDLPVDGPYQSTKDFLASGQAGAHNIYSTEI